MSSNSVCNDTCDYRPNWTPLSPVTIIHTKLTSKSIYYINGVRTMANLLCTSLVLFQIWNNFYEKLKGASFCSFKHSVTKP